MTDADGQHNATGLELARAIAKGLAGKAMRRTTGRSRLDPATRSEGGYSGAHPDDRDPQLLDSTIGRLVAEQGWSTDVRVHEVFTRWEAIVGREIALHCSPESFDLDAAKLVVRTDSTAWATNLRMMFSTLVATLARELGDDVVRTVDVVGPSAPSWKRGRLSVKGRGPRDTYG